jgi:hypothetical protein
MGWSDRFKRKTKTEDVLIVVLCGNHNAHASLLQLASECDRFSALDSHRFTLHFQPITSSPQELARNTACGIALEKLKRPDDTLVMIDNDMIQQGWNSLRILDTPDYDIAGGLQYMWLPRDVEKKREPEARPCAFLRRPEGEIGQTCVYPEKNEKSAVVDRVGSGFMAVKRRVLADERMLLAPGFDPPAIWRNVYAPNFVRTKGLDMDFCDRAKGLGYRVVVNWQAEIGHNKTVNVNEIDLYAKRQWISGYEIGVNHGVQMARFPGGAVEGADGEPGSPEHGDGGLAEVGMDRADRSAQAAGA